MTAPWHSIYGRPEDGVLRPGEQWMILQPSSGESARHFMKKILEKRLKLPEGSLEGGTAFPGAAEFPPVVEEAVALSGGNPRFFLQLLADAANYAQRQEREWPLREDLALAADDLSSDFRRSLRPGDVQALAEVQGTDGLQMPLDRKVRLSGRGLVYEQGSGNRIQMVLHPLVRPFLPAANPRA